MGRKSRWRRGPGRAAILACTALGGLTAPALAADPETLTLSPSQAVGDARAGIRVGPFSLLNTTRLSFRNELIPVLIGQNRTGGIVVRTDAASMRKARRHLSVRGGSVALPPGARVNASARLRRLTPQHNFYGGVLLRNVPTAAAGDGNLHQVLQLNAALFLRPRPVLRRVRLAGEGIRVEQAGRRRLRFLTAVRNRGNVDFPLAGSLTIRALGGKPLRLRRRLEAPRILPGAVLDLAAASGKARLPAGRYLATARVRGGGREITLRHEFELFGPNAVATRKGRLTKLEAGSVYAGEHFDIHATWRNRGNVAFAPRLEVELRPLGPTGPGRVAQRLPLRGAAAPAGRNGELRARLGKVPKGTYVVNVRLLAGKRELDRRTLGVNATVKPALSERAADAAAARPLVLGGAFTLLLLGVVGFFLARERRLRARLTAAEGG